MYNGQSAGNIIKSIPPFTTTSCLPPFELAGDWQLACAREGRIYLFYKNMVKKALLNNSPQRLNNRANIIIWWYSPTYLEIRRSKPKVAKSIGH
jgi:hypothetical protein